MIAREIKMDDFIIIFLMYQSIADHTIFWNEIWHKRETLTLSPPNSFPKFLVIRGVRGLELSWLNLCQGEGWGIQHLNKSK